MNLGRPYEVDLLHLKARLRQHSNTERPHGLVIIIAWCGVVGSGGVVCNGAWVVRGGP